MEKYKEKFLDILSWIILNPNDTLLIMCLSLFSLLGAVMLIYWLIVAPMATLINILYVILWFAGIVGTIFLLVYLIKLWEKIQYWAIQRKWRQKNK